VSAAAYAKGDVIKDESRRGSQVRKTAAMKAETPYIEKPLNRMRESSWKGRQHFDDHNCAHLCLCFPVPLMSFFHSQSCRIMLRQCCPPKLRTPFRFPSSSLPKAPNALRGGHCLVFSNADQSRLSASASARFCLDGRRFSSTTSQEPSKLFPGAQYGTILSRLPLETVGQFFTPRDR
jgi:hypothetical protein